MNRFHLSARLMAGILFPVVFLAGCSGGTGGGPDELPVIRPDLTTGFSNGGWNLDRYPGLEPLKAGARITIGDLSGPGIIRHIHTTRHHPAEVFARGIVLEIWFDDAATPAVSSPLADFFGDGGNGRSTDFSADLIECAPWSYNSYGCWVDYATVYYWYQDEPGGFSHAAMESPSARQALMVHPNRVSGAAPSLAK